MATKRGGRTVFGVLMYVLTLALAGLNLPGDIADIGAEWASFKLSVPQEVVRLLLVAVLGTVAAWALSPGVAWGVKLLWMRRQERILEEAEAAERARKQEENQRRQQVAIRDYLAATAHRSDIQAMLVQLLEGPAELDASDARFLQEGGIVERRSWTAKGYHTMFAAYSLTDAARPFVEDHIDRLLAAEEGES